MWDWPLDYSEIRDDLIVGSCPKTATDVELLRQQLGVTAVLSLQEEACRQNHAVDHHAIVTHGIEAGLEMRNVPMRDFDSRDQRRRLPQAVRTLAELLRAKHRVYVHCSAGINRGPLVVLGYLTLVEGLSYDDALGLIECTRPEAAPYRDAWQGAQQDLLHRHRDLIEKRAFRLYRADPSRPSVDNWRDAEREVLREVLTGGGSE